MANSEPQITSVVVNDIYPEVSKSLTKNLSKYKKVVQKFFEARSKEIYDNAPYTRIYFGQNDVDDYFNALQLQERDIEIYLSKAYFWNMNFNPRAAKNPFTECMICTIRHFLLKNDKKTAELSSIYLAFSGSFYPSIHYGIFPTVQPVEYRHVMEYVVNNMLSQKFDLKREGSVFGAIRNLCRTWLDKYEKVFRSKMTDEDVKDLIQQLHGRIKSLISNIAELYYKVYNDKDHYLSYDSDSTDEDSFRVADNDSLRAERYVENTMNIVNNNNIDMKICKLASDTNVKVTEVQSIIESIQSHQESLVEIKELVRLIIYDYMANSKEKDVRSIEFISKSVVAKPNSKNKNVVRQKEIIESWLDENSPQYRKRKSRPETKASYFRSIMSYYVLLINKANK